MGAARQVLVGLLADILAEGLAQDRATLAAIAGALGVDLDKDGPRSALALLAREPDSAEHAPLAALVFSPGAELLRRLEPALAAAGLDAAGAEELAKAVARIVTGQRAGTVPLLLPDGPPLPFPASAEDLRGFVRRLRAEATAPDELRQLLARRYSPELAADLAVRLRHSRLSWTPAQIFFLATLLERAKPGQDNLPDLVDWATAFLDIATSGGEAADFSPREALSRRRQALEAQLRQAEFAEKAQAGGSFELRLSQGLRLAHVHGPDVAAELALLHRASRLVLGAAGQMPGGQMPGEVTVRDLGAAEDLEELLRLLP